VTYALSLVLGIAIQFLLVLAYYFFKHPLRFSVEPGVMRNLLIGGLPLFIWGFLQTAYGQIDATLLSLFADVHVVGWWGAAGQITNVLVVIPTAVSAVALPMLCELYVRDKIGFDLAATRTLVTTLLIAAPVGAGLAISAGDVLRLLPYPAEFQHAAPVLTLLALALPVTGVLMVLSTMAVAIGRVASTARPVSRPLAPRKLAASRLAAGVAVFSNTDTVLLIRFAVMRSTWPSPLTSAVVTENGTLPTA